MGLQAGDFLQRIDDLGGLFRASDHERNFAADRATGFELLANGGRGTAKEFLVDFGDFPCQSDGPVTEEVGHIVQGFKDAVRALVGDDRSRFLPHGSESIAPRAGFGGKESDKAKAAGGEAGCGERCQNGGRSRQRNDRKPVFNGGAHDAVSGVGDQGRAGVAHQSHGLAALQSLNQLDRAGGFVVLVITEERLANLIVLKQFLCLPGIFACDNFDFLAQDTQSPKSNVF